jgi:transcriptional regulator with XRE-family HTH domain
MGASPRVRPQRLASKLSLVRTKLGLTQAEMAEALSNTKVAVSDRDISKYEKGKRDPSLVILLRYSRLARVKMEIFADDDLDLPK